MCESADIFALTETFLVSSVHDAEVFPAGYNVLRRDRANDAGWGGVLLAVRDHHPIRQILDIDGFTDEIEVVSAIVELKHKNILLCVVYIPPNSKDIKYINTFEVLENIIVKYSKLDVLILGDFNLNSGSQIVNQYYNYLVSFCKLHQYNYITNKYGNMLDLVLSNLSDNNLRVIDSAVPLVPPDAHHPPLSVWLSVSRPARAHSTLPLPTLSQLPYGFLQWNFRKSDLLALYDSFMDVDWNETLSACDVNEAVSTFYNQVYQCLSHHVPLKNTITRNLKYRYPVWYNSEIIKNLKYKYFHLKKIRQYNKEFNKEMFRFYRQHTK